MAGALLAQCIFVGLHVYCTDLIPVPLPVGGQELHS
jgi:hypothetical protein